MAIDDQLIDEQNIYVERVSRVEFLEEIFAPNYEIGEHVSIVGPTNSGKTYLANQMADKVATPDLPVIMLVMKPKDDTVRDWQKKLGLKKTATWPPVLNRDWRSGFTKKFRGYVFWPRHSLIDIRRDDEMLQKEFRKVLTDCYRKGDRIVFADEVHGIQNELQLKKELDAIWMRGRSMGCGMWASTQRPRNVSYNMYSQAEHLLLFKTPDSRDAEVYAQIGAVDPELVKNTVSDLSKHEFVYIGRTKGINDEPTMIIVGAN